jgi:iron complex outermembrane receptor protein
MLTSMLLLCGHSFGQIIVTGKITDKQQGIPLPGTNITLGNSLSATVSDEQGNFTLSPVKPGKLTITVSYVGFKTIRRELLLQHDTVLRFDMEGATVLGDEVNIIATRAQDKYPTAFISISNKELRSANLGQDIPSLIQGSPSTIVTSDAGNGVGYSGISIRGTDLTRINVTINSVPVNDAESQGVWFVDLPDLASSTANLQIQRGVGTSTNGAGAFGASINFMTSDLHQDPYGEMDISGGSYNTFKTTLRFGTGLMTNKFSVDGRLSYIRSDGYIDRASSNLKSYYLSGGYYGKKTTIKLITFSGYERTYQAWEGVPKDSLATNRTYNPAGEYHDKNQNLVYYNNQTDNYQQDNYQLIFSQMLAKNWNFNAVVHYTKGKGYYENYKQSENLPDYGLENVITGTDTITSTDLITRKMMDNDFCGITFSTNYSIPDRLKLTVGGAWNRHYGRHFGKIIWAEYASNGNNDRNWYYNTGLKTDFNIFGKLNYQVLKRLSLFADLQYRHVGYKMEGTLDDLRNIGQSHQFDFFNPKGGLYLAIDKHNDLYFSFGIANREPSRNNFKDADPDKIPSNETLYDYEIGYGFKQSIITAGVNLYYMNYKDQLVLTGEINNVGEAVMVNVPHSYRTGIELSAGIELLRKKLLWNVNATFSRNKIKDFTWHVDTYDADWNPQEQTAVALGETNLSFSPDVIAGSTVTWKPFMPLSLSLNSKYIGRQYIDNTGNKSRSLHDYFLNGLSAEYTIKTNLFREIGFTLAVNNIFNQKYESNAWVYSYYLGNQYNEVNGYFPQALINFLFGISVKI